MYKGLLLFFAISMLIPASVPDGWSPCGTTVDLSDEEYEANLRQYHSTKDDILSESNRDMKFVPVQVHIVHLDDGSGGVPEWTIQPVIDDINADYQPANIFFYHPEPINHINSSEWYSCDNDQELDALRNQNDTPAVMDIFIVSDATSGGTSICGISTFTWYGVQGMVIAASCWDHETGSHEVGHYFDLFHTHNPSSEYVDGTACTYRGDGLCDTPADPDLSIGGMVSGCVYTGTENNNATDGHGDLYDGEECMEYAPCAFYGGPDTHNIMSYNLNPGCSDNFTTDQIEKAEAILLSERPEYIQEPDYPYFALGDVISTGLVGDGDGVINPGESVELVYNIEIPDIWPTGGQDILVTLKSDNEDVIITNSDFYLESCSSGQSYSNLANPAVIEFSSDAILGGYDFNIEIQSTNFQKISFDLDVSMQQYGFPFVSYPYSSTVKSSPLAIDINQDGVTEVLFGDNAGRLQVVSANGQDNMFPSFPFSVNGSIWGSVAAADLNNDGAIEFVVGSQDKSLYIMNSDGLASEYISNNLLLATPAIGNIDSDDDLEIIIGGYASAGEIYAINYDGTPVDGFPLAINEKVKKGVALADFNGNSKDDIVFGTDDENLYLVLDDGTVASGFPYQVDGDIQSAPSILEIDNELIIFFGSKDKYLYSLNSDGTLRFKLETDGKIYTSPAIGDFADSPGIFFGTDAGSVYGLDVYGGSLPGWPIAIGESLESVVFADIDGDSDPEVVVGASDGNLYVFYINGELYSPYPFNDVSSFTSGGAIADIDGDNDLEILVGTDNGLSVFDDKNIGGSIEGLWNVYRGNSLRNGLFVSEFELGCDIGDINADSINNIQDIVLLVNIIIGASSPSGDQFCAADMNADGIINIQDIVLLVSLITSQ